MRKNSSHRMTGHKSNLPQVRWAPRPHQILTQSHLQDPQSLPDSVDRWYAELWFEYSRCFCPFPSPFTKLISGFTIPSGSSTWQVIVSPMFTGRSILCEITKWMLASAYFCLNLCFNVIEALQGFDADDLKVKHLANGIELGWICFGCTRSAQNHSKGNQWNHRNC